MKFLPFLGMGRAFSLALITLQKQKDGSFMICFTVKYSIVGQLVEIVIVGNWDSGRAHFLVLTGPDALWNTMSTLIQ